LLDLLKLNQNDFLLKHMFLKLLLDLEFLTKMFFDFMSTKKM
jgi:hypothetical protein